MALLLTAEDSTTAKVTCLDCSASLLVSASMPGLGRLVSELEPEHRHGNGS